MYMYELPLYFKKFDNAANAKVVVIKVPYEMTTSFGVGCRKGPDAIVNASSHVELFDESIR